jgi:uncharacterized protein (DUF885 family)
MRISILGEKYQGGIPPQTRFATLVVSALLFAAVSPLAAQPASLQARLAAQNALFEESWQTSLKLSPTLATNVGDYRYNDQLGDFSLAASATRHDLAVANLAKIKAIDPTGFPESDLISHQLFERQLQQSLEDYVPYKQFSAFLSALYAEELGKEIGFYTDPGSDYGRLRSELFRAVRLVVDTGIHDMNWSRDQVVDSMRKSHAIDEPTIQAETGRYISGPGQACSYKLGQLKIRELRERAKSELGPQFDLKTFHDEILSGGALPLDVLDARVTRWIKGQLPATAKN